MYEVYDSKGSIWLLSTELATRKWVKWSKPYELEVTIIGPSEPEEKSPEKLAGALRVVLSQMAEINKIPNKNFEELELSELINIFTHKS